MDQEPDRLVVDAEQAYNAERRKFLALAHQLAHAEQERDEVTRLLACVVMYFSHQGELRVPASLWFAASQVQQKISVGENPLSGEKLIQVINVPAQEAPFPHRDG